jgi:IMP cyclohydrolase
MTSDRRLCAAYRVSSRSFPNRRAVVRGDAVSIIPKPGHESDVEKNPYIAYNCARIVCDGGVAVVTNGSQTDPISEKVAAGMSPRDALVLSLLALDYEHDDYNTPRICAVADKVTESAWLGVVREDGLNVARMSLDPGHFRYVATYEESDLRAEQGGAFPASTAEEACDFMLGGGIFAERSNAVTAVAAFVSQDGFDLAAKDEVSA